MLLAKLELPSRRKGPPMSLFEPNKDFKVRGVVLKLINTNCPELATQIQDTRSDRRANLAIVVALVPIDKGEIQGNEAFTAVTKDFSSMGVSVVTEQAVPFERVILGFRADGDIVFLLAETRHVAPMGGGLYQVGFQLLEVVSAGEYPGLDAVSF
jgi:hypothetical protein